MKKDTKYQFSYWLFNRYVEATRFHYPAIAKADYLSFLQNLLQLHLEHNLQGRGLGLDRQTVRRKLKEITAYERNSAKYPLDYIGEDGNRLRARDEVNRRELFEKWSRDEEQTFGRIGYDTEIKAVNLVGKVIKSFDRFRRFQLTSLDNAYLTGAANNLLQIIEQNGFDLDLNSGKVVRKNTL